MKNGFKRRNFSNFMADYKRASRQMLHTCELAEQNGVAPEAMASVCLEVAAELMTRTSGADFALETLQLTVERIQQSQLHEEQFDQKQMMSLN